MADADESMMVPDQPAHGVLGTLWLVSKKTGLDMQSYPIDAERVTIGRDYDSDVRLYFSDVSKLHCEIKFDPASSQATLHVHGTHGIKYAAHGQEFTTYKPPAIIPLSDKDMFVVRKKHFRFEYGHEDAQIETPPKDNIPLPSDSPVRASPARIANMPSRKRASYRMSLVPSGKHFEPLASPMKSRRHSIIGLGDGPQVVRTPKKSGLSKQIEEEEEEEVNQEEEEMVVEACDGEEGDVLYIEQREEEVQRPIHQNPFMTPQQKGKAPMRNTSVVPRSRKQVSFGSPSIKGQQSQLASSSPDSPKTPRSVPLPAACDTPYASNASTPEAQNQTPRSVPLPPTANTPYNVPAQVAMATPRGPFSLHKALLVRSARKRWESDQAQGIDGAIQSGVVSTRRKSMSPVARDSRKSLTPMPDAQPEVDDDEEESEEDEAEEQVANGELQWVYEDGTRDASVDESDSSLESFEADTSMEIPGQGVLSFTPPHQQTAVEGSFEADDDAEEEEEEDEEEEEESDLVEQMGQDEEDYLDEEEDEQAASEAVNEAAMETEQDAEADALEDSIEDDVLGAQQSSTPVQQRSLNRFYTPQPQRSIITDAPRTLASIGGPAVRFQRLPETPSGAVRRIPATPGSLGAPSRRMAQPIPQEDEEDVSMDPSTPVKREVNAALLEEAKRRRETLGTPRHLPAPPPSFKTPVREAVFRPLNRPAPHPALEAYTPDREEEHDEPEAGATVPMTPVERIERKLNSLRRQSMKRQSVDASRRATVGFALPATPARPHQKPSAAYTVGGTRRAPAVVYEEQEDIIQPSTPTLGGMQGQDDLSVMQALADSPEQAEAGPSYSTHQEEREQQAEGGAEPATPYYTGMREMFRSVLPPKTPSFAGMKSMFASGPSQPPATPHYSGMKTMFQEPTAAASTPEMSGVKGMFYQPAPASTPALAGIKNMYQLPQNPATPAMDGLREMYEIEEVEREAALQPDTDSEEEEEEQFESTPWRRGPAKKAPAAAVTSTSISSRPAAAAANVKPPIRATTSKLPTASAPTRKPATTSVEKKVAAPTARKTSASTSAATRAKTTSTTTAAAAPKRATAAKKAAPPPPEPVEVKPRPGDLDDCSTEIDESLEDIEPVKPVKPRAAAAASKVSRSAPTRSKQPESAPVEKAPAARTANRGKKAVLGENDEQPPADAVPAPAPAKATRARKAAAPSATTSTAAKTTTSTSAPTRRTRTVTADKENEPESEPVAKKAPVRRTVKKAEPAAATTAAATTTRTTRSRK